jgi:hypothetical protein
MCSPSCLTWDQVQTFVTHVCHLGPVLSCSSRSIVFSTIVYVVLGDEQEPRWWQRFSVLDVDIAVADKSQSTSHKFLKFVADF